ncbi:MAG: addiction module protein [Gemmataceae bacterium]|nr:addiction module protein [Planctomycetia bacterium]MBX3399039.1 addiction module protein [Gemmataceae bacterium]
MSESNKALMQAVLELPEDQRLEIADAVYDSLSPSEGEDAFDAELDRRAEEIRNGTAKGRPVEDVMRELRERFP